MSDGPATTLRLERHYGDRVFPCFADRPASIHAMLERAVAQWPDHDAVIDGETRLSYRALEAEVAALAGGLAALGVARGDRVALLVGNSARFVALLYAAARLGAAVVPISVRDQTPGVRHALVASGAKALVVEADYARIVPHQSETPELIHRLVIGAADGFTPFDVLHAAAPRTAATELNEEAVATILFTSGTTGLPKGAMLTNLGVAHSSRVFCDAMGLGPNDRTIVVAPMTHVTGLVAGVHTAICAGAAIIVMHEFKAPAFVALAARERMTFTLIVPAMYNLILQRADLAEHDLSAWRIGGYGGAPMPAATIERLAETLPNLALMNAYGATETTSPSTLMPPAETARRRLSVGRPAPGATIAVMDDAGREQPRGAHGELWISGPMVVPGYWNNPEATAREFVAGFWKSGDIGSIDDDGFVYVHDRKKDMINRGGYKIFSAHVENVLAQAPGVLEAAVVAKPCPVLGERVHAVIVRHASETDAAALERFCEERLADDQRPESYTLRDAPLPRNANGKVMKQALRQDLGFVA